MPRTMSMVEARNKLTSLPEDFAQNPDVDAVAVTRRGKPVLAVMPWELYEAIVETLDVLGDAERMAALRQSIEEAQAGKGIPWKDAKRTLGL
jgi:PHD/YefM family antitoxin component YafN of YafNO toxin-antitoxin module